MPLTVINKIDEAFDGKRTERLPEKITHIIIHRLGETVGTECRDVIAAFKDTSDGAAGSWTGGQIPYTFWIARDGGIGDDAGCYQLLELGDIGWHALRWSRPGIGIALCGDFRTEAPTPYQWNTVNKLCNILALWIGKDYALVGHTDLPGATKDTSKECPGEMFGLSRLQENVEIYCGIVGATQYPDGFGVEKAMLQYGITL